MQDDGADKERERGRKEKGSHKSRSRSRAAAGTADLDPTPDSTLPSDPAPALTPEEIGRREEKAQRREKRRADRATAAAAMEEEEGNAVAQKVPAETVLTEEEKRMKSEKAKRREKRKADRAAAKALEETQAQANGADGDVQPMQLDGEREVDVPVPPQVNGKASEPPLVNGKSAASESLQVNGKVVSEPSGVDGKSTTVPAPHINGKLATSSHINGKAAISAPPHVNSPYILPINGTTTPFNPTPSTPFSSTPLSSTSFVAPQPLPQNASASASASLPSPANSVEGHSSASASVVVPMTAKKVNGDGTKINGDADGDRDSIASSCDSPLPTPKGKVKVKSDVAGVKEKPTTQMDDSIIVLDGPPLASASKSTKSKSSKGTSKRRVEVVVSPSTASPSKASTTATSTPASKLSATDPATAQEDVVVDTTIPAQKSKASSMKKRRRDEAGLDVPSSVDVGRTMVPKRKKVRIRLPSPFLQPDTDAESVEEGAADAQGEEVGEGDVVLDADEDSADEFGDLVVTSVSLEDGAKAGKMTEEGEVEESISIAVDTTPTPASLLAKYQASKPVYMQPHVQDPADSAPSFGLSQDFSEFPLTPPLQHPLPRVAGGGEPAYYGMSMSPVLRNVRAD
jgi:hypothetical protein